MLQPPMAHKHANLAVVIILLYEDHYYIIMCSFPLEPPMRRR